jgi:hypothetical protein
MRKSVGNWSRIFSLRFVTDHTGQRSGRSLCDLPEILYGFSTIKIILNTKTMIHFAELAVDTSNEIIGFKIDT